MTMNKKLYLLFACICFFIFSPASAHANAHLVANYYVESGKKLFDEKNYESAIKEFNKALLVNPDNEEALMYLRMLGLGSADSDQITTNREQGKSSSEEKPNKKTKKNAPKSAVSVKNNKDTDLKIEQIKAQVVLEEKAAIESLRAQAALEEQKISSDSVSPKSAGADNKIQNTVEGSKQKVNQQKKLSRKPDAEQVVCVGKNETEKISSDAACKKLCCECAQKGQGQNIIQEGLLDEQQSVLGHEQQEASSTETDIAGLVSENQDNICKQCSVCNKKAAKSVKNQKSKARKVSGKSAGAQKTVDVKKTRPVKAKSSGQPTMSISKKQDISDLTQDLEEAVGEPATLAVVKKDPSSLTFKEKEAATIDAIKADGVKQQAEVHKEFAEQEKRNIKQIHAKYKSKGIGKNEKAVLRDLDGDGVKERISSTENKAIEKMLAVSAKKEKAALKDLDKKVLLKEKAAIKRLHAQTQNSKKEISLKKVRAGDVVVDQPDIIAADEDVSLENQQKIVQEDDIQIPLVDANVVPQVKASIKETSTSPVGKKSTKKKPVLNKQSVEKKKQLDQEKVSQESSLAKMEDVVQEGDASQEELSAANMSESLGSQKAAHLSAKEQGAGDIEKSLDSSSKANSSQAKEISFKQIDEPLEVSKDLIEQEKVLHEKFEQKKAALIDEVKKKSEDVSLEKTLKPAKDQDSSLDNEQVESVEKVREEALAAVSNSGKNEAFKAVESENLVLKKKLAQVVEMAEQDQKTIKDLEKNVTQKSEKAQILENDLVEAKQTLESKKEAIKEQTAKMKDLQTRISAMEVDLHSKQYDFKDKQLEYEKKLQAIEEEFGNYKSEKAKNEEELQGQLKILKEALAKKISELNEAQEKLIFVENKLEKSEAAHKATIKEYEDLKKTMSDLEGRLTGLPTEIKTDQLPVVSVDPKNLPKPKTSDEFMYQQWIARHDKLITKLKEKLLWAREQMDYLGRYDIKLSDQKMAALKEQLAAVKKQLSAQDGSSSGKPTDYALTEERLKDAQQRLEMVEKILREKDEQIQELEKQLNGVLSAF